MPSEKRFAYLFRTPLLKSYSGLILSTGRGFLGFPDLIVLVGFFIHDPFTTGGEPSADDSNVVTPFHMGDNQQAASLGQADEQVSIFSHGMIGVRNCNGERIAKSGDSFFEAYPMLKSVASIAVPASLLLRHVGTMLKNNPFSVAI